VWANIRNWYNMYHVIQCGFVKKHAQQTADRVIQLPCTGIDSRLDRTECLEQCLGRHSHSLYWHTLNTQI